MYTEHDDDITLRIFHELPSFDAMCSDEQLENLRLFQELSSYDTRDQCPICLDLKNKLKTCKQCVHQICQTCKNKTTQCPYCRLPYEIRRKPCKKSMIFEIQFMLGTTLVRLSGSFPAN